ncbi:hypothetical protein OJF2_73070 [Aquisphaera giovannonii]|uniref:Signal peptidase I n=1 Tax=Aquisphaera giovannonii TaxID=406548 RepID=A0A5B9WFF6_9BACT|nr:S26 family signal peptidase [Aquisphaera giovannonii]QEH38701.1 hypothetical protein OJF2_73070 [Aquisphaera giovannonii]
MQCPSCRFENMPGLDACGRCGTSLTLAGSAIDVNPPRASRSARQMRRLVNRKPVYRAKDAARSVRGGLLGAIAADGWFTPPPPGTIRRLIVPGLAQIHAGNVTWGWLYLGSYAVFLLLGLLRWGSTDGPIFIGLAISAHASSVVSALMREHAVDRRKLFLFTLFVTTILYALLSVVLRGIAAPLALMADSRPFAAGDVLLVNNWAFAITGPRRGDVVVTRPSVNSRREVTDPMRAGGHRRDYLEDNQVIDRVIGLAGDRVVWEDGRLSINGEPVSWTPLVPDRLPARMEIEVPEHYLLVLPTMTAAAAQRGSSAEFWKVAGLIDPGDVEGGVWLRIAPLSRFRFIR